MDLKKDSLFKSFIQLGIHKAHVTIQSLNIVILLETPTELINEVHLIKCHFTF
jgi:hypothetical protein